MTNESKVHVHFNEDASLYLQEVAKKIEGSVAQAAHLLVKLAKESEITIDITLKTDTLTNNQGKPVVRFRRRPRFRLKL